MSDNDKLKLYIYDEEFEPVLIFARNREEADRCINVAFPTRSFFGGFDKEYSIYRGQCLVRDKQRHWKKAKVM